MKSDNWIVRLLKILSPIVIYFAITFVTEIVILFGAIMWFYGDSVAINTTSYEQFIYSLILPITGISALITLIPLTIMYRRDKKRLEVEQPDFSVACYIIIPVLGVCACFLLNCLLSISGMVDLLAEGYESTATAIYSQDLWMQYLVTSVVVPCVEELIFRGLIFKRMRTYSIFSLAALLSSAMFGIYHMNLLQFIYATCLGLLLAYVYEQFRTIVAPILLHGAANAFSVLLTMDSGVAQLVAGDAGRFIFFMALSLVGTVAGIYLIYRFSGLKNLHTDETY